MRFFGGTVSEVLIGRRCRKIRLKQHLSQPIAARIAGRRMLVAGGVPPAPPLVAVANEAAAAAMSADMPHQLLTTLTRPSSKAAVNVVTTDERSGLLRDAEACVAKMKATIDVDGNEILGEHAACETAFVAAALAIMCGRFQFSNGKPNPSKAAETCGKQSANAKGQVEGWIAKLTRLEKALAQADSARLERERQRWLLTHRTVTGLSVGSCFLL